jgi:hypothetical protein
MHCESPPRPRQLSSSSFHHHPSTTNAVGSSLLHPIPPLINMAADHDNPADFFFKGETARNTRGLLRLIILCTIAAAAVASRLFSVIRFESIIHECMDNTTKSLVLIC